MPVEFEFGGPGRDVDIFIKGAIGLQDLIDHVESLKLHPRFRPQLRVLADCEGADLREFGSVSVQRLVDLMRRESLLEQGSVVAVAAPHPVVFGLVRMFELSRRPPYRLSAFRTRSEAVAWLTQLPES